MTDLLQNLSTDHARQIHQWKDETMKNGLKATDWDETPIVDFVWTRERPTIMTYEDIKNASMGLDRSVTIVRHESPAPKIEDLQPVKKAHRSGRCSEVQRVTKPLLDKVTEEYDISLS